MGAGWDKGLGRASELGRLGLDSQPFLTHGVTMAFLRFIVFDEGQDIIISLFGLWAQNGVIGGLRYEG